MKKSILILCIAAFATITNAQPRLGIKGGMNFANMMGADAAKDFKDKTLKIAINLGLLMDIPVSSSFSIQPEAVFSMQGTKVKGIDYQYNYINLLAAGKFNLQKGFSLFTGPQLGILTSPTKMGPRYDSADKRSSIQSTAFGWTFGLGYLSSADVGFDARYNTGIGTIDNTSPKDKFYNAVIQLDIYYLFSGKKRKK